MVNDISNAKTAAAGATSAEVAHPTAAALAAAYQTPMRVSSPN
jgi:hypothetical protein